MRLKLSLLFAALLSFAPAFASCDFNGTSSDYLVNGAATPITGTPYSVIAWVKSRDVADYRTIYISYNQAAPNDYFQGGLTALVPFSAARNASTGYVEAVATSAVAHTTWVMTHHLAASATSRKAGFSAANEGSETTSRAPATTPNRFNIGSRYASFEFFDGLIAIVAVYGAELSSTQLSQLNTTVPLDAALSSASLAASYDMRAGCTTTVVDDSGSIDLTVIGAVYSADNPTFASTVPSARRKR